MVLRLTVNQDCEGSSPSSSDVKCGSCRIQKPCSEFYKNNSKKSGISSYCKLCNTLWVRKRYLRDKNYYDKKSSDNRLRNRKHIYKYLSENPCVDCGETDPIVLEFDHIKGKNRCVSNMMYHSIKSINIEIEKCQVRCANCHRRKTAKEFGHYKFLCESIVV